MFDTNMSSLVKFCLKVKLKTKEKWAIEMTQ